MIRVLNIKLELVIIYDKLNINLVIYKEYFSLISHHIILWSACEGFLPCHSNHMNSSKYVQCS